MLKYYKKHTIRIDFKSKEYSVDYINNYIIKPAEIILQNAELKMILSKVC